MNVLLILFGKLLSMVSRFLNAGSGSTWPGHIALMINPNFIKDILRKNFSSNEVRSSRSARTISDLKIILIAGTNGKTTTVKLIQTILEKAKYKVFQNKSGANLLNGIASSLLLHSNILSTINYDYAIFEVDEATLPLALNEINPDYLILLNLFRDQLDRYGEVNTIANKWADTIRHLLPKTQLILNADDPQIAFLSLSHPGASAIGSKRDSIDSSSLQNDKTRIFYFGLNDRSLNIVSYQHAVDSTYCPNCSSKLHYKSIYYSHLGDWECKMCGNKRSGNVFSTLPPSKLAGTYNLYNILAATLVTKKIGIFNEVINNSLKTFTPAFGRQEILNVDGKKVQIFLSKNPTSFNESLRTIKSLNAKNVLFVLNDRIPDGRDVSWIWDVDFENYVEQFKSIIISGDRCFDLGLRIKYAIENQKSKIKSQNHNSKFKIYENLDVAIKNFLKTLSVSEALYILPTYSAMLEVRKILTGKKIL